MKCLRLLTCLYAVTVASYLHAETVIEGVVKLPPAKPTPVAAARYQQKAGGVAVSEPPTAVVYLDGVLPASTEEKEPPRAVEVKQQGFQFIPALVAVQKGTSVLFPNLDDDYHHVFSYSKAKEFDLGRYRKDEKQAAVRFEKPGVVKVGCEIHDHMRATVLVLETPVFTKTDPNGKFTLPVRGVPDGKYVLKAWVNERDIRELPVELKQGAKLQINFPGK